ncbi:hypothetical protein SRIMM317S_02366 [Streptomyces rimosus subsp. rimosus]
MAARNAQTGRPAPVAARSQAALTSAPAAMRATPFSGPSQRSCESCVRSRCRAARSAAVAGAGRPVTYGARARTAAQTTSLPRPMVKHSAARPPAAVRSTT